MDIFKHSPFTTETQTFIEKLRDKQVGNQKQMVHKETQTVELELIEPNEINCLKANMPFKNSRLKDKGTHTEYSCFYVKVNDLQHESGLSNSDEDVADNVTSFHISQCDNDAHRTEFEFTSDCNTFETNPNNCQTRWTFLIHGCSTFLFVSAFNLIFLLIS